MSFSCGLCNGLVWFLLVWVFSRILFFSFLFYILSVFCYLFRLAVFGLVHQYAKPVIYLNFFYLSCHTHLSLNCNHLSCIHSPNQLSLYIPYPCRQVQLFPGFSFLPVSFCFHLSKPIRIEPAAFLRSHNQPSNITVDEQLMLTFWAFQKNMLTGSWNIFEMKASNKTVLLHCCLVVCLLVRGVHCGRVRLNILGVSSSRSLMSFHL